MKNTEFSNFQKVIVTDECIRGGIKSRPRYDMDNFLLQDLQFPQVTGKCIAPSDIAIIQMRLK